MALTFTRVRPYLPVVAIVGLAAFITWAFAAVTLAHTPSMGLPLDDSYIYLTYAKQFGRGQPFTYFPGGGYSAGSTSVLWPMLLAPFWTFGARGHALVWVSFGMGGALYAAVAVGCYRFVRSVVSCGVAPIAAPVMALVIAPFAFCALSGMEVALAAALLVATVLLLAKTPGDVRPSWKLVVCLAALSLSRPEATPIAFAICGFAAIRHGRHRRWRIAAWWLAPLIAPIVWLSANKLFAGQLFPNTGVAKSHFYLPGFDWTYWLETVKQQLGHLVHVLCWDPSSPLVWPRAITALYVIGAVRILMWARREQRWLAGALVVGAPIALMVAVVCTSGVGGWTFQNYRYVATAFPIIFAVAGVGMAPPRTMPARLPHPTWIRRGWCAALAIAGVFFVRAAVPNLRDNMLLFAQGAMDTNAQVVTIGQYLHQKLPDARVMFHDAGAVSYYGDGRVYDMLGLVTNYQAGIANNGPGARFEFLESLPPERRPTHFAYYPGWMGQFEFYGEVLLHTSLRPGLTRQRLVGEADMQLIAATWDHVHTAERPLNDHGGWAVVDRVDIADMASERAHHWIGRMGRRRFGDPTARWSIVEKETAANGLVIDGGRTIRDGGETFITTLDPAKATRVVIRTGGQPAYGFHETITKPITLKLFADGKELGHLTVAPPSGTFSELTFNFAPHVFHASTVELRSEASGPYRVFHWFVLQPE